MSKLKDGYVELEKSTGAAFITIHTDDVVSVTEAADWVEGDRVLYKTCYIHTEGQHYHRVKGSAEEVHAVLGWR